MCGVMCDEYAFDDVAKFADVAGIVVASERFEGFGREDFRCFVVRFGEAMIEVGDE